MHSPRHRHICGLHFTYEFTRQYLPQVKLQSHTTINPVSFTTTLTQTFHNPNAERIEKAQYTFPLYDGVAVNGYVISYGDQILRGVVEQKDEARQTYQAAVDRGETASLLESLPVGLFGVTIGNIPAKSNVVVEITYCGELKHDAAIDGLRYVLPTSIAPRYGDYPGRYLTSNTIANEGVAISVDVDMLGSAIRKVQSPSHPIAISMGATSPALQVQAPFNPSQASVSLTLGTTELAHDFILQLLIDDISKPQAVLEVHPTIPEQRAIMATLVPRFKLEPIHPEIVFIADQSGSMQGSKNAALVAALRVFLKSLPFGVRFNICAFGSRFKFLWPRSQAYNETNLTAALEFVGTFGAHYGGTEILPPVTAAFENRLLDLPLEVMLLTDGEIFNESNLFKYINEQVHEERVDARVFALGIGGDVSHTLVEGVARAGNGFAQFVTDNEEVDLKVIRMLKGALYAHAKDYELELHFDGAQDENKMHEMDSSDDDDFEMVEKINDCLRVSDQNRTSQAKSRISQSAKSFFEEEAEKSTPDSDEPAADRYAHLPDLPAPKLLQAPSAIPPLFPFNRTTVYVLLGPESIGRKVTSVTLRAQAAEGPLELKIPVQYPTSTPTVATIHQLAARKAIQDLEEDRGWLQNATAVGDRGKTELVKKKYESRLDEIVEREAVRLGTTFQVASRWTSFVAVTSDGEKVIEHKADDARSQGYGSDVGLPGAYGMAYAAPAARMRRKMSIAPSLPNVGAAVKRCLNVRAGRGGFGQATTTSSVGGRLPSMTRAMQTSKKAAPSPQVDFWTDEAEDDADAAEDMPSRMCRNSSTSPSSDDRTEDTSASSSSRMRRLIDLQTFSGAWNFHSSLFAAVGVDMAAVNKTILAAYPHENVFATALAIAFLELRVAEKREVWELVVAKARTWLASQVAESDVSELVAKAAGVL